MSARDDYQHLAELEADFDERLLSYEISQLTKALDETDQLRAANSTYARRFGMAANPDTWNTIAKAIASPYQYDLSDDSEATDVVADRAHRIRQVGGAAMSVFRRPEGCGAPAGVLISIGLCLLAAVFIFGCGVPADATVTTDPATTVTVSMPALPRIKFDLPAVATTEAVRSTSSVVVPTTPPFDCATYVNGLPYSINDPEPAREAYRVTASCRGWDAATIAKWEHFIVDDVMRGESRYCPLIRRGAQLSGVGCELAVGKDGMPLQGRFEDSGIMQLVGDWYRPGRPLCEAEGLCSSDAIIASPWASFNAGLFAVEYDGRHPWAYDARSMAYHPTWPTVTRNWP